jgi:hypothetical protein
MFEGAVEGVSVMEMGADFARGGESGDERCWGQERRHLKHLLGERIARVAIAQVLEREGERPREP